MSFKNLFEFRFQRFALQIGGDNLSVRGDENDGGDAAYAVEAERIIFTGGTKEGSPRKLMLIECLEPCIAVLVA